MRNCSPALWSLGGGAAITLVTGLYSNIPGGIVGAVSYGFPLAWLRRLVIAPQYNPWRADIAGLVTDLVIWALVVYVLYITAKSLERRGGKPKGKR